MNKTSIIILTYNHLPCTIPCIQSIRTHTPESSYELIVVDNHSTDGTCEWLKQQEDIRLIANSENKGFPAGCNQGIRVAEEKNDILLLNNDTLVTPHWLQNLQECLHSAQNVGAVGPVTNFCSNGQQIQCPIDWENEKERLTFASQKNSAPPKYEQKLKLIGFCMLIKRAVVDKIGLLDERFFPGNYEDDDYSFRIGLAGFRLLLSHNTFIYHKGSASFGINQPFFAQALTSNAKKFHDKWGFSSAYATLVREDVIGLMKDSAGKPLDILEIGCACGATLLKIQNMYPEAHVFGLEYHEREAAIAAQFANVKQGDVENPPLPFENQQFDYILFPDVLEHLREPGKVLQRMHRLLKPDGYILASIPNVMHYSVVNALLHGRFTYEDTGILDRTHLRFFTLLEIQRMFLAAGYELELTLYKYLPISESDQQSIDWLTAMAGGDEELRAQFGTYQYLIRVHDAKMAGQFSGEI